jgi:hypothetical protein
MLLYIWNEQKAIVTFFKLYFLYRLQGTTMLLLTIHTAYYENRMSTLTS